jgi:hypothetical protein
MRPTSCYEASKALSFQLVSKSWAVKVRADDAAGAV